MFASRYYNARQFAARYFPKVGADGPIVDFHADTYYRPYGRRSHYQPRITSTHARPFGKRTHYRPED